MSTAKLSIREKAGAQLFEFSVWEISTLFQGALCFCFALNLLTHGSQLHFSNIPLYINNYDPWQGFGQL